MSRSLLDTNIISNVTKRIRSESLVLWMAEQADGDLLISAMTVAEIQRRILEQSAGRKRRELESWFSGPGGPSEANDCVIVTENESDFAGLRSPQEPHHQGITRQSWPEPGRGQARH